MTGERLRGPRSSMERGSFTDRVMARVAEEPTPSPGRVFVRSLRHLALRDAVAALAAAWRLAFEPTETVAASARGSAAALFLSVIVLVGIGGALAAGGALSLFGPDGAAPQQIGPAAAPTSSPVATIRPAVSPSPAPSPSPTPLAPPPATTQEPGEVDDRAARETPVPTERQQEKKKRATPTPETRERDPKDEPGERDEKDEPEKDD